MKRIKFEYLIVHALNWKKKKKTIWKAKFAWKFRCDRIIWTGKGLKQVSYNRGESNLSDHRPVMAIFTAEVEILTNLKTLRSFFLSNRFEQLNSSNTLFVEDDNENEDEKGRQRDIFDC